MSLWQKFINRFSMFDLVMIAMTAALGVATKPIIVPLAHLITGPLFIPGGALAGGFYMMWLVIGAAITGKRGTATLVGLVQGFMVLVTGFYGSHGVLSILTYSFPGVAVDIGLIFYKNYVNSLSGMFFAGILANVAGTISTNWVFFRLPFIALILSLAVAAFSGGLGGMLAYKIVQQLNRYLPRGAEESEEMDIDE